MRFRAVLAALFVLSVLSFNQNVDARGRSDKDQDPVTQQARDAFVAGTAAVKAGQWSEALASFEKANKLKECPPIITFNIGYCQRCAGPLRPGPPFVSQGARCSDWDARGAA